MIPLKAIIIPKKLLRPTGIPLSIQPSATIAHVFQWLTTVLDRGPALSTMKIVIY